MLFFNLSKAQVTTLRHQNCRTESTCCNVSWVVDNETEPNATATRLIEQHGCEHMACPKGPWERMAYATAYITRICGFNFIQWTTFPKHGSLNRNYHYDCVVCRSLCDRLSR